MAMDKERLMSYFQTHYLSRQEVLFKLPLNVSIDSFWNELLSRRKARATVLPLNNSAGMPYWYVLTDRMVAASERLCEEALNQETLLDPYRASMTSAMTEEMFFTSFVEGAQIPLQEAMDFLQRGTEPESIQEQMIWNNRRAWAEMMGTLYRPLDERFVRSLAFILTEEMDNCAEDYRQSDQHPIAAMNSEEYAVPPAYSLPDRMREYYGFLQQPDLHPLIRAAAAQAYLLVTRPFPEGNERLSRMMSSAVLLRSGYDFFRDISISSVIARESYRYYKCMCEIIRGENGGDMTYFMEYYLELLVRALDAQNERTRKREQEALEREREMAREPLRPAVQPAAQPTTLPKDAFTQEDQGDDDPDKPPRRPPGAQEQGDRGATKDGKATSDGVKTSDPDSPFANKAVRILPPVPLMEPEKYLEAVSKMKASRYPNIRAMPDKIRRVLDEGIYRFTTAKWAEIHETDRRTADYECRYMYEKGWMTRDKKDGVYSYTLRITPSQEPSKEIKIMPANPDTAVMAQAIHSAEGLPDVMCVPDRNKWIKEHFESILQHMEVSSSALIRDTAAMVRRMSAQGFRRFTKDDWMEYTGMNKAQTSNACDYLVSHGMVINISVARNYAIYVFEDGQTDGETFEVEAQQFEETIFPVSVIKRLEEMAAKGESEDIRRIGAILLQRIRQGFRTVGPEDIEKAYGLGESACTKVLMAAINLGVLCKGAQRDKDGRITYAISCQLPQKLRPEGLTTSQKRILTELYAEYKDRRFSTSEGAKVCHSQLSGFTYHMRNLSMRGILDAERHPNGPSYFTFAITPEQYPQCFLPDMAKGQHTTSSGATMSPMPMSAAAG